jgi:O-antigen/teichoic acid export membrane protein
MSMNGQQAPDESESRSTEVVRGAALLYTEGIITNVVAFLFFSYIAMTLSAEIVGQINAFTVFISILASIGSLSINHGTAKFISEARGGNDAKRAATYASNSLILGLLSSGILATISILALPYVFSIFGINYSLNFPWIALAVDIFCTSLAFSLIGSLQGYGKYSRMGLLLIGITFFRYGAALVSLLYGLGLEGVVAGWATGNAVGTIILAGLTISKFFHSFTLSMKAIKPIIVFTIPIYLSMVIGLASSYMDRILVLSLAGVASFAVYTLGITLAALYWMAVNALQKVGFPEQSYAHGEGGPLQLIEVSKQLYRYVFLFIPPFVLLISLLTNPLITLFFPAFYSEALLIVIIVLVPHSLLCYEIVANGFLMAIGKTKYLLHTSIIASAVGFTSGFLLTLHFGLLGAALSRFLMDTVLSLYPLIIARRKYGLYFDTSFQIKALAPTWAMIVPSFITLQLPPLLALPATGMACLLVFLIILKISRLLLRSDLETLILLFPLRIRGPLMWIGMKLVYTPPHHNPN